MSFGWIVAAVFLGLMELGHRRGHLVSIATLLAFFPLRSVSYRLAYGLHDFFLSEFKGILDFKLRWTESALRWLGQPGAPRFQEGIRLLRRQPQIEASLPVGWAEGIEPSFFQTPGGIDRLSDFNLLQIDAFVILLVLLGVFFGALAWMTRDREWRQMDRIAGAAVLSIVALMLVYQALLMLAPSVWMVPDSPVSQWIEGSCLIKELFYKNPLIWV